MQDSNAVSPLPSHASAPTFSRALRRGGALTAIALLAGCASYTTPGAAYRFDSSQPAAGVETVASAALLNMPVRVAVARVQAAGYQSYSMKGYGSGLYSVLATPAANTDAAMRAISTWPGIAIVMPIAPDLLPPQLASLDDLRLAAAKKGADVLFVYTLATTFNLDGQPYAVQTAIPLSRKPDAAANIAVSASGQFIDVRTGLVNGVAAGSASVPDLAAAWSSAATIDAKRVTAENAAFAQLIVDAQQRWATIAAPSQ